MTTNRLAKSKGKSGQRRGIFRASEYAAMARAKGLTSAAEAWDKADREGWDHDNYNPEEAAKHREHIKRGISEERART